MGTHITAMYTNELAILVAFVVSWLGLLTWQEELCIGAQAARSSYVKNLSGAYAFSG